MLRPLLILQIILKEGLGNLHSYLADTETSSYFAAGAEKTTVSIRTTMTTYVKSLKYVQESENNFSINDWIHDEGGCAVVGLQNYPQLEEVYGVSGARAISALLSTRFMFREPDPNVAQWSAFNLGEIIKEEVRESTSYGANSMRDGRSINRVETRTPLVSFSEIMGLKKLQAYVRLPAPCPIILVDFKYKERKAYTPGFIARPVEKPTKTITDTFIQFNT